MRCVVLRFAALFFIACLLSSSTFAADAQAFSAYSPPVLSYGQKNDFGVLGALASGLIQGAVLGVIAYAIGKKKAKKAAADAARMEKDDFESLLSSKPTIATIKATVNISSESQAASYKRAMVAILKKKELCGSEEEQALSNAIRLYRTGAFESARKMVFEKNSEEWKRVESCLQAPAVSGAQAYVTPAYIAEHGIPADAVYCFLFYGFTGKPISDTAIDGAARRKAEMMAVIDHQNKIIGETVQDARSTASRH